MLLKWWSAREVVEIGTTLADSLRPEAGHGLPANRDPRLLPIHQRAVDAFLRRVTREVAPLKLGFLRRAKLLNAFKWRLREHGFDRSEADELTQMVLFQLYGAHTRLPAAAGSEAPSGLMLPPSVSDRCWRKPMRISPRPAMAKPPPAYGESCGSILATQPRMPSSVPHCAI